LRKWSLNVAIAAEVGIFWMYWKHSSGRRPINASTSALVRSHALSDSGSYAEGELSDLVGTSLPGLGS
jgi:hypothetical protein